MEALLESCLFRREWDGVKVNDVAEYARTGKAKMFPTGALTSFAVKETHQSDLKQLPTGARTLLLDMKTGSVVVRGVNKFFDIEDVESELIDNADKLWELGAVWLQRKMAGFAVTLFSLDGESVSIATKHVVEGPHVDMARRILETSLSAEQQKNIASDLFSYEAALSCECIFIQEDFHHPVPEGTEFDRKLVVFSVHKRNDLREISVPLETMRSMLERWGMLAVPCWRPGNSSQLHSWLWEREQWGGKDPSAVPLAEGYVLVVEMPLSHLSPIARGEGPFTMVHLRLKAKTVKYRVLRSMRSIISGDSITKPLLFHEILAVWLKHIGGHNCIQQAVAKHGIFEMYTQFETFVKERGNTRLRGGQISVKQSFERLLEFTEKEAQARRRAPLHVLMLCGVPGSGKTTLSRTIAEMVECGHSSFRYVMQLNRDRIAREIAEREGIDNSSSKHKQRRLRSAVHHSSLVALHKFISLSFHLDGPGLLIMDACNAKVQTRRLWRSLLPRELESFRLLYVNCTDHCKLVQRLDKRRDHDVLHNASEAQAAFYAVRKVFVEPTKNESCMWLDTAIAPAKDVACRVLSLYKSDKMQDKATILDHRQAEDELATLRVSIIGSLVGPFETDTLPLPISGSKQLRKRRVILVRLEISFAQLFRMAAEVMVGLLARENRSSSWWEKCKSVLGFGAGRRAARVEEGHTRWVCGWLLDGCDVTGPLSVEDCQRTFGERFECTSHFPHITLFYDDIGASAEEREGETSFFPPPAPGDIAEVTLESLLLDRHALSLAATVLVNGKRYERQLNPGEKSVPLHVTVAHTPLVKASYAGTMFDLFSQWEKHNAKLEGMKHMANVKRSRLKFYNFLSARLEKSVCVRGTVVVES